MFEIYILKLGSTDKNKAYAHPYSEIEVAFFVPSYKGYLAVFLPLRRRGSLMNRQGPHSFSLGNPKDECTQEYKTWVKVSKKTFFKKYFYKNKVRDRSSFFKLNIIIYYLKKCVAHDHVSTSCSSRVSATLRKTPFAHENGDYEASIMDAH